MPQPLPDQLWRESLQKLELQMTRATFETWLKDTRVIPAANNGDLVIGVQSEYAKKWLEDKLMETVSRTVTGIVGRPVRIEFVVREEPIGAESAPALEDEETGERDAGDPVEISGAGAPGHEELAFVQDTNFHQVKTDMGRWLPELQYDSLFWNAYLGTTPFFSQIQSFVQAKAKTSTWIDFIGRASPCTIRRIFSVVSRLKIVSPHWAQTVAGIFSTNTNSPSIRKISLTNLASNCPDPHTSHTTSTFLSLSFFIIYPGPFIRFIKRDNFYQRCRP